MVVSWWIVAFLTSGRELLCVKKRFVVGVS